MTTLNVESQDPLSEWTNEQIRENLLKTISTTMAFVCNAPLDTYREWWDEAHNLLTTWVTKNGTLLVSGFDGGKNLVPVMQFWQDLRSKSNSDFPLRKQLAS